MELPFFWGSKQTEDEVILELSKSSFLKGVVRYSSKEAT